MMETEEISETLVSSSTLTRLIARENVNVTIVTGTLKLSVSINEPYNDQGQPFLPAAFIAICSLEDRYACLSYKYDA
jgi:hypothetical protein